MFLIALFLAVFISARLFIRPINDTDYQHYVLGLQAFWSGKSPYLSDQYYLPTWSVFFLARQANSKVANLDGKTLGLLLGPVWSPYMLQYSYTATVFTMRRAGWLRNLLYVLASIGRAFLFWRDYHVAEQIGAFGMVLMAALLAPSSIQTRQISEKSATIVNVE